MQQGNFIDVFLAQHIVRTYAHHQEHLMLNCSIRFSAPSFWKGGGLESRCIGRVYGAVLQIGRSLVQSQLVSLEFLTDIKSFRSHYGPRVDSASNRNEYQEHFLGVKAASA